MQSEHQKRVQKFMELAGQAIPDSPTVPDEQTRLLRAKLILEEALETIEALGVSVNEANSGERIDRNCLDFSVDGSMDLVGVADGCADISVVTQGTLLSCGIKDKPLLEEVDNNNLAKFGPGHSFRDDGKVIKPPNHMPPNIEGILSNQSKN